MDFPKCDEFARTITNAGFKKIKIHSFKFLHSDQNQQFSTERQMSQKIKAGRKPFNKNCSS